MKPTNLPRIFLLLALFGIASFALSLTLIYTSFWRVVEEARFEKMKAATPTSTAAIPHIRSLESLGEAGSECGGQLRAPCRPGTRCEVTDMTDPLGVGVCKKDAVQTATNGQAGDDCNVKNVCGPRLVCKKGKATSTCATQDESSVQISSIRFAGAEPVNGGYRARPKQTVEIQVNAVNASDVQLELLSESDALTQGRAVRMRMTKKGGGVFAGTFTLSADFSGELRIIAQNATGDFTVVPTDIASIR